MKLNAIFRSHMVFSRRLPIRIYGTGAGEGTVTFAGITKAVAADTPDWLVELPPMEAGGPYELTFRCGGEETVLTDIYVGEVYLFAGQSNVQFKMRDAGDDTTLYETNEMLRMFFTDRIEKSDPYTPKDGWVRCDRDTVDDWSALGCIGGHALVRETGVAVGIIACYQGASVIESWVPEGTFEQNGISIPLSEKHFDHTYEVFSEWNGDGTLYHYALSQVVPFSLTGVVWYQGESDTSLAEAKVYARELQLLIEVWRQAFRREELPFVVVQLADFCDRDDEAWRTVQAAQEEIRHRLPYVETVISRDVCESDSIHPLTKGLLAERIAAALVAMT